VECKSAAMESEDAARAFAFPGHFLSPSRLGAGLWGRGVPLDAMESALQELGSL